MEKEIRHLFGKAVHGYGLIEDGDKIGVAFSGGKDSVLLLHLLKERLKYIPIQYELKALYVDLGFNKDLSGRVEAYLMNQAIPYEVVKTDVGLKAHSTVNRENPCFLCSRLRRKIIFEKLAGQGFKKIAFGHNQDDFIETFFLNILYSGQVSSMLPRQSFFKGEITVIRPLVLIPSSQIDRLVNLKELNHFENPCPSAKSSRRSDLRRWLLDIYKSNKKIRGNVFRAMSHINREYILPPLDQGNSYGEK